MTTTAAHEPRPTVKLVGEDGNSFRVIGACVKALRRAGASEKHIAKFTAEATSGDYDKVLQTAMTYCDVL